VPKRWITPTPAERRALARIAAELSGIGLVLPGSVAVRSYRCGKDNCACHAKPPRLHGPYHQWSRRAANKTVHVNLSPDQLADYQGFFDTYRRLRALVDELEALSLAVIERDPRLKATRASTKTDRTAPS
jgi:hypothetical protein